MKQTKEQKRKERIIAFCWQHLLLLISLWIMTAGVAVCVRSMLGSSVISVIPYMDGLAPALTIGQYTYIMNAVLVLGQICVLRRRFEWVQLSQLVIGFLFGTLLDLNMALTAWLTPETLLWQSVAHVAGCAILGVGIAMEVRCGSVTMPGEGFPVAISRVTGIEFPKVKIAVDIMLVAIGIAASFLFFGGWKWNIIGVGTLFAMVFVGFVVRVVARRLGWFDRLLAYRPGFRRYLFGLARIIYPRHWW